MFSGLMVIMFHTIPLQLRPIYQGAFGAIFAVASVVGPLVGGTFTDKVTWRWCFYINLPVGAISLIVTSLILHLPDQKLDARGTDWKAILYSFLVSYVRCWLFNGAAQSILGGVLSHRRPSCAMRCPLPCLHRSANLEAGEWYATTVSSEATQCCCKCMVCLFQPSWHDGYDVLLADLVPNHQRCQCIPVWNHASSNDPRNSCHTSCFWIHCLKSRLLHSILHTQLSNHLYRCRSSGNPYSKHRSRQVD